MTSISKFVVIAFGLLLASLIAVGVISQASNRNSQETPEVPIAEAVDFADSSTSTLTISGPIVAREEHYQIKITVNRDQRIVEYNIGYTDSGVLRRTFSNDLEAYQNFLAALDYVNFGESKENKIGDVAGYCATGYRYVYQFIGDEAGYDYFERWSNSCDKAGDFAGNGPAVRRLFKSQIPGYDSFIEKAQKQN